MNSQPLSVLFGVVLLMAVGSGCPRPVIPPPLPEPTAADLVVVPAGSFERGCDDAADPRCPLDERPHHQVTLDAFQIERTEVTNAAYHDCLEAGACRPPHWDDGRCYVWNPVQQSFVLGRLPPPFRGDEQPVVCVSHHQALDYCAFRGRRLCSEAEWEKAARGTDGRQFPWGDESASCERAVMNEGGPGCGSQTTLPVGQRPDGASPYGVLDMVGNVAEWTADWYRAAYYPQAPRENPTGPPEGMGRSVRGGSFGNSAWSSLRASRREGYEPNATYTDLGLRCCAGLE